MKFKKGSKVEVLSKKDVPSGSWCCAEVIHGNGHYYTIKFECSLGKANEAIVERVSQKTIRPCPPVLEVDRWESGDIVEVFIDCSWEIATVLKATSKDYYLVKLLGSSHEYKAQKSHIRMRQSWQGDDWVVIGKGFKSFKNVKYSNKSTLNCQRKGFQLPHDIMERKIGAADELSAVQNNTELQESCIVSSRTLKRCSPYCSSHVEVCRGNVEKRRATEENRCERIARAPEREKVDAIAYPSENLGEKYMHASFSNGTNGYYKLEREDVNITERPLGESRSNDSNSDACSVGSCSMVSARMSKLPGHFQFGHGQENDNLSSDAESFCDLGNEEENCSLCPREDLGQKIHMLELHAYRSTLEAFYASGSLSWEQEALLTNLRISLHISNDEHLIELRNLGSTRIRLHLS